ncbi:uncharacterized protein LOC131234430 isoform X2 [Magnolia sinica]|uniref:uncharacterized protein LOC131234430 isoform X2 n=1 Tax=Magnolia sinica TaxID=86752 RepID=UPI0026591EC4|nr:uncharacterized protein LOC131234430 isoform X2 [Magnolia sinica]
MMDSADSKWSPEVEDLVDAGDTDGAISLLESLISKFETLNPSSPSDDRRLACALSDLSNLYSTRGFSIKADELQNRALVVRLRSQQQQSRPLGDLDASKKKDSVENTLLPVEASPSSENDDWETIADRPSNEFLSPQDEAGVSNPSLEHTKFQTPKRRGRGAFMYEKNGLYSDQVASVAATDNSDDEVPRQNPKEAAEIARYGTSHALVLSGFPPSTRTTDLEKVFQNFRDRGVVIRWVNDTLALAVFRTPSIAQEARGSIDFPFVVRALDEGDSLLSSLSSKDLEPPIPRPKTSSRTAQRLIAQGMGRKLSTTTFGSNELKKQEEARRNRIHTRQIMRDEAWGPDDPPGSSSDI